MAILVLCFVLVLARVAAFVAAMPVFGGGTVPRMVKVGLSLLLAGCWFESLFGALPIAALATQHVDSSWLAMGLAVGREVMLGMLLGFAFGLFLMPARVAGELLAQETGFGVGALLDPSTGMSGGALAQLFELLSILLIFILDGHHLFLAVAHGSFARFPVGATLPEVPVQHLVSGLATAQEWGMLLAMPVGVCLFLTTVLLLMLNRAAPQLNLYSVGFPMRLIVGLGGILLLMPNVISGLTSSFGELSQFLLGS